MNLRSKELRQPEQVTNKEPEADSSHVSSSIANAVLAEGLYHALIHIRAAVRFHQVLQLKSGNKKTLLLDIFILMNNT